MARREDVNLIESFKSKLDTIINALNALAITTSEIERFFASFYSDRRSRTTQSIVKPSSQASASKNVAIPITQALLTHQYKKA